jgi:indole-3-glycerol phosphate synthase
MPLLEQIARHKRVEVAVAMAMVSPATVRERARKAPPPRDFAGVLRSGHLALIAEIKRRSPASGLLRSQVDAAALAREYVAGGARALSVVTDGRFFGGRAEDLVAARAAVGVPVLRKDFVLEPYQVYESRALGADALLLIAALLDLPALGALVALCADLGMAPLVEVHSEGEAEAALRAGARLIGINNRDLHTFAVDLETTARLRARLPRDVLVVSESGIHTAADVTRLRPYADAVLVGTALMQSEQPAAAVRALLNGGNEREARSTTHR